jgi:exopolysaccharide production protein ExoQ
MLALAAAGLTGITLIALRGSRRSRVSLVLAALIGVMVIFFKRADIKEYLSLILDLDSPTRGVDSGATGRTDIWQAGIELVFSDAVRLFTGRGIRSALPEIIGFPVESSYINLALEHGLFFGSLIVLAFVVTAWRALQQGLQPGQHRYQLFMAGLMLVFILAQSIFNRYLIGVGNPYSLWILVLTLQLNLGRVHSTGPVRRETFSSLNIPRTTRIGA